MCVILCIFANWRLYPFRNGSDNELTMRHVFIIIMILLPFVSLAQENKNPDLQLMESVKGQMKNSYMEVKWIDDTHFTYSADESEGKVYYITDTRTWKAQRMFDNKAFADSLNKISQGGQSRRISVLDFLSSTKRIHIALPSIIKRNTSDMT